jgi:diaminopimelate epimerase
VRPTVLWKYHGAQNDFLFLEAPFAPSFCSSLAELRAFARQVCHRHAGFGADGLVLVEPSRDSGTLNLLIVNSDGSLAATCGNALRCVGLHALNRQLWSGHETLRIARGVPPFLASPDSELADDERELLRHDVVFARLLSASNVASESADVDVSMGHEVSSRALVLPADVLAAFGGIAPSVAWRSVKARFVELSNPHVVLVGEGFNALPLVDLTALGRFAQSVLPARLEGVPLSNIGFLSNQETDFSLSVYERGAGLTQCCGSGATAARVALEAEGLVAGAQPWCAFKMPGGIVSIGVESSTQERVLRGPAEWVGCVQLAASVNREVLRPR